MENTTSRLPGTTYIPSRRRWRARIRFDRRHHHLGYFKTSEDAHAAYVSAQKAKSAARMREAFDQLAEAWRAVATAGHRSGRDRGRSEA